MKFRTILVSVLGLLALAGCRGATVSQSQCIASDWQTIGYRDGVGGMQSTRLLEHQDACVKHGVIPDRDEYMAGWRDGVVDFCQPDNGFAIGSQGRGYANVCPNHLTRPFVAAYQNGRELYGLRSDVANLERRIQRSHARLDQLDSEIVASAAKQLDGELTPEERINLIALTQRLHEEKTRTEVELPQLQHRLDHKRAELDSLSRSLAAVY